MDTNQAIAITQKRLAQEGRSMGELLNQFRDLISQELIGELHWKRILQCAERYPIALGAFPFGFEIPLHSKEPAAGFGLSLWADDTIDTCFDYLNQLKSTDEYSEVIWQLLSLLRSDNSSLREIVGRKLRIEYNAESGTSESTIVVPNLLLRPIERPILGANQQVNDVIKVVTALFSCMGWILNESEQSAISSVCLTQPKHTRTESFGICGSRSRSVRLAVMGFEDASDVGTFLDHAKWSGRTTKVHEIVEKFRDAMPLTQTGVNIDVGATGLRPELGLSFMVNQRTNNNSRYWIERPKEWEPFLGALSNEAVVVQSKLTEVASWNAGPRLLFGKTGKYVLISGIHHFKLEVSANGLQKVNAYLFLILTGALAD